MKDGVFAREPLDVRNDIPVFSVADRFTENYERIARDHLKSLAESGTNPWIPQALWTEMEATTIELIGKYAKPGDMILDVGVGLARLLSHFPSLQRHGMDISDEYLEIARAKGVEVCNARVEDMPYKPGIFDVVVCTDMLEHVLDLNLCCTKILSVLKEGSVLIVRVPVHEDLSRYVDPAFPYDYVHLRNFDENSLRLLFDRVLECEVLEITPGGYWPLGDRLRITLPLGREASIAFRVFAKIPGLRRLVYRPLVKLLYHPIEANVVVRKRPGWKPRGGSGGWLTCATWTWTVLGR